ncbi:MAG: MFS transporter [Acuticoccus sp.]
MTNVNPPRSVQSYLDETPIWPDGTGGLRSMMTAMQQRIWVLAAAGKFFEGMIVFMGGVALPLIAREFGIGPAQHGMVTAASLLGILVGASVLGGMSDIYGRKKMFIVEMIIFTVFLVLVCFSPSFWWLVVCLFGLGIALGCDYPTAHLIISETMSSDSRGRLVLGAFAFQAVGALCGTAVGYLVLANVDSIEAWRIMYAVAIVPAIMVIVARFFIPESPHFLVVRGDADKAERMVLEILERTPRYPRAAPLREQAATPGASGYKALFRRGQRRATILASVPWFLQDLGTYGIGIFTPVILATAIGHKTEHATSLSVIIHNDILAAKGAALIDCLLIVGVIAAILLADKVGRMRLQMVGFVGCAVGLAIAALSSTVAGAAQTAMIFAGFMLFNFMTNMGPNAQTYLIAGEVFPTEIRAKGAGFAASFAKIGAVATAFLFPILINDIGTDAVLWGLVVAFLLGAIVTYAFRIETAGRDLETIGTALDDGAPNAGSEAALGPEVGGQEA